MGLKIFTATRCAFCKKEIEYRDISAGRKYFCSKKHRDEYMKRKEKSSKALSAGNSGGKGCCG
jgi:hypothetical protein